MKHHYEIMRIMRTKIVDPRELSEGVKSMSCVEDSVTYRVGDLTSTLAFSLHLRTLTNHFTHRQLFSPKAGPGEAVPKFCIRNCDSLLTASILFYFLTCLSCSSSISIIQSPYGLGTIIVISNPGLLHMMMLTKTKISNRR